MKRDGYAIAAGIVLIVGGAILTVIGFFIFPLLIYGILGLVLGIVVLVTLRQQEYVEPIKKETSKKRRRLPRT